MKIKTNHVNDVSWRELNVTSNLPESLRKLDELAHNLWWVWSSEAKQMFRKLNPAAWKEAHSNPVQLLNILSHEELISLANDTEFISKLESI